jgi:type VI secretion system protein ImpL
VLPECRSILAQGYPFQRGEHQTSIDDFSRLFRPGGLIDQFVQSNMAGQVSSSSSGWTLTPAGRALGLSPATVRSLEQADRIRRAFFKPGDVRPNVRFILEPVSLPSNASAATLTLDGTPAAFEGAAHKPVELHWPGPSPGVVVSYQGAGGAAPSTHSWSGDWAVARMLDETRTGAASSSGLNFAPNVETYRAIFHIRFEDGVNPFALSDLRTFSCPSGF